jgi:NAD+ kinase
MEQAAVAHDRSVATVDAALKAAGCTVQRIYRARLRPEDTRGRLVVCVGGDGTVLDASHRILDDSIVLGVNSDPDRSIGFLCATEAGGFASVLDDVLCHRLAPTTLQRLGGTIDGRPLPVPALNELLIGHKSPASTSRYRVERQRHSEDHKSSGVYVCTAAGSTAAMSSAGGEIQALDDGRLQWRVRELLTIPAAHAPQVKHQFEAFFFDPRETVTLTSRMREGRVWIDGPHVAVDLPLGARLEIHGHASPLRLIVSPAMAERRQRLTNRVI